MALCRAQLRLLAEGLGASISVVYMTEELEAGGESKLLPIVVYPETEVIWAEILNQMPIGANTVNGSHPSSLLSDRAPRQLPSEEDRQVSTLAPPKLSERGADDTQNKRHQILLPLVSDGTILGLLVTTREVLPWNSAEQTEIQHIAQTISLAGILDRRQQWLTQELKQQQKLQIQQQDMLHNLLHQLRNPLTAIRTFGKLLIKRLQAEDPHRGFAGSIVRESDRLQELLTHLEMTIDIPLITAFRRKYPWLATYFPRETPPTRSTQSAKFETGQQCCCGSPTLFAAPAPAKRHATHPTPERFRLRRAITRPTP